MSESNKQLVLRIPPTLFVTADAITAITNITSTVEVVGTVAMVVVVEESVALHL